MPAQGVDEVSPATPTMTLASALQQLDQRGDIVAAGLAEEAEAANVSLQRRRNIPDLTLNAGYKTQADGFSGAVFGLSMPLPLWNQNGGAIAEAAALEDQAALSRLIAMREARTDLINSWNSYCSAEATAEMVTRQQGLDVESMLAAASVSYEQGEMSVIELLNATTAANRMEQLSIRVEAQRLTASFNLERALHGIESTDNQTNSAACQ